MIGPSMLVTLGYLDHEAVAAAIQRALAVVDSSGASPSRQPAGAGGRADAATYASGSTPPPILSDGPVTANSVAVAITACPVCGAATSPLQPHRFTCWCPQCRRIFVSRRGQPLCRLPACWSVHAFAAFLHSGLTANGASHVDLAFTRYMCDRLGVDFAAVATAVLVAEPQPVTIGRLAVLHGLLAPHDVEWVLQFQQAAAPARRKLFGEVAITLGLLTEDAIAPLLMIQAERARGFAAALATASGLGDDDLVRFEARFFGLGATAVTPVSAPVTALIGSDLRLHAA